MKAIITVLGKDKVGIIAGVCVFLAERRVNVLEISQTIVKGYFDMMMIADLAELSTSFEELSGGLDALGVKIGVIIRCQREDIFESMHRI